MQANVKDLSHTHQVSVSTILTILREEIVGEVGPRSFVHTSVQRT